MLVVSDQPGVTLKVRALAAATSGAAKDIDEATQGRPLVFEPTPPPAAQSDPIVITQSSRLSPGTHHAADFSFGNPAPPLSVSSAPGESSVDNARSERLLEERRPMRIDVRGYAVEREIGRGGMGTVYLARQLSLDRAVALKVMSKRWSCDPIFVARFTREAYAAAQLSHPNIVHIHDIGETNGTRFFSMEYVRGRTLADVLKLRGKLDPETAVGYVLQAARGLKHAHDRGMIHRDVKPDNLLLDDQGLVKVADLGLVKTPSTRREDDRLTGRSSGSGSGLSALPDDMTGARIALGTPAYMSPEQCRDAAAVDHRADIYSLGCTLYVLVTGRPPFEGTTAVELMTKHAYDALVPPEQIVARVPKEVSAIIQRMMAKNADDRFQSMSEVIRTLEAWLGIQHSGTFSPHEEQISRLEGYVHQYNYAPTAVLRRRVLGGFFAAVGLTALLIAFFGNLVWAFGLVGLVVQAGLIYFIIDGVACRSHLFVRTRQFILGLSWGDWAIAAVSIALFLILLAMLKVFWVWTGFGILGLGVAFALRYGLDRPAEEERRIPVDACERLLRRLRAQGLDEEELRQFVAKFSGRDWEGMFEALFGYEAKLGARAVLLRGGAAGVREKYGSWREPLISGMDRIEMARRAARERKLLQAVEQAQLLAAGAAAVEAEGKARAVAEAMVEAAGQVREAEEQRVRVGPANPVAPIPVNVHHAVVAAEANPLVFVPNARRDPISALMRLLVGAHTRAILAATLLAACGLWVHQNSLVPTGEVQSQAAQAIESKDFAGLQQAATRDLNKATRPLDVTGVPREATSWVDGWNVGAAGMFLLASLFFRGNVMAIFTLLGAAVAAVGHQYGIRTVEPFRAEHVALMLGSVLALVGFRASR